MTEMIKVDKDRFEFLWFTFFGSGVDPYEISSKKAYRDLCRTLRFFGGSGQIYREKVDQLLKERISLELVGRLFTQKQYDDWHRSLCMDILKVYQQGEIEFHIGQAQKWINMMLKYLYIYGGVDIETVMPVLHVPLDHYVFDVARRTLSIEPLCYVWSKVDDYDSYLAYQSLIRARIKCTPFRWELSNWLEEAKSRGVV